MKLLTTIPFSGFYESVHSDAIEAKIEQVCSDEDETVEEDIERLNR